MSRCVAESGEPILWSKSLYIVSHIYTCICSELCLYWEWVICLYVMESGETILWSKSLSIVSHVYACIRSRLCCYWE